MNNNSNHNTVWILGLIVVLVLGVLIGTNMKKPSAGVADTQQGAVGKTTTLICRPPQTFNPATGLCENVSIPGLSQTDADSISSSCIMSANGTCAVFSDSLMVKKLSNLALSLGADPTVVSGSASRKICKDWAGYTPGGVPACLCHSHFLAWNWNYHFEDCPNSQ